jgi:hypothetical protein
MTDSAEPAFPNQPRGQDGMPCMEAYAGLTKREYFAAMAMQGIIAGHFADTVPHCDRDAGSTVAHFAVLYADALLAELERTR